MISMGVVTSWFGATFLCGEQDNHTWSHWHEWDHVWWDLGEKLLSISGSIDDETWQIFHHDDDLRYVDEETKEWLQKKDISRFWRSCQSLNVNPMDWTCGGSWKSELPSDRTKPSQRLRQSAWKNGPKMQLWCANLLKTYRKSLAVATDNQSSIEKKCCYWTNNYFLHFIQINSLKKIKQC